MPKYTFQLNILGNCEKSSIEELRADLLSRFQNLSEEDVLQFTDVYVVEDGVYKLVKI